MTDVPSSGVRHLMATVDAANGSAAPRARLFQQQASEAVLPLLRQEGRLCHGFV
jgi:hypothetical protein